MGYRTDWLQGIFPALVTPFTADDRLDEAAYRRLIRALLPDVQGLVPCGTTGEFPYLTSDERRRAIEVCVDEVAGRVPVIAGTGATTTRETVALTAWARDAGADAALVVTPYYLKSDFNEVYEHFRAVDAVGQPMVLYNIPQCSGTHLKWWTAEGGLLDFEHAVGIKDSSGDMPFLAALLEKVKGRVSILVGHDEMVQPALGAGLDGAILASANLVPSHWQKVYQAIREDDLASARAGQQQLQKLARIVVRCGPHVACKEGLRMLGHDVGVTRQPSVPADVFRREDRDELRLQLEALGCLSPRTIRYRLNHREVDSDVLAAPETPATMEDLTLRVGEGFAGPPLQEIAHVDLLIGEEEGPVGRAITRAIQEPSGKQGLRMLGQRPRCLLVPTVTIRTEHQAQMFEAAGRGVLRAVEHSIEDGFLPESLVGDLALIVNAFVHTAAAIERRVELNNYKATRQAIRRALERRPHVKEMLAEQAAARHPFRYAP